MLVAVLGEGQKTARVQSGQERVSAVERGDGIVHRLIGTSREIAQQQNLAHCEFGMGNAKMVLGCPVNTAHRPKLRVVQIRGDLLFLRREPEEKKKPTREWAGPGRVFWTGIASTRAFHRARDRPLSTGLSSSHRPRWAARRGRGATRCDSRYPKKHSRSAKQRRPIQRYGGEKRSSALRAQGVMGLRDMRVCHRVQAIGMGRIAKGAGRGKIDMVFSHERHALVIMPAENEFGPRIRE